MSNMSFSIYVTNQYRYCFDSDLQKKQSVNVVEAILKFRYENNFISKLRGGLGS